MLIEFAGLPGVGKSTLANALLQSQNSNTAEILLFQEERKNISNRKLKLIFFIICNPIMLGMVTFHILKLVKLSNLTSNLKRLKKLLVLLFDLSEMNKNRGQKIVLMDQGIVQMLASFPVFQNDENVCYIDSIYKKIKHTLDLKHYYLVWIKANSDVAINRMLKREKTGCEFKHLDHRVLSTAYSSYLSVFEQFDFDFLVNSNNNLNKNVLLLREWINGF